MEYVVSYDNGSGWYEWASAPQPTKEAAWEAAAPLREGTPHTRLETVGDTLPTQPSPIPTFQYDVLLHHTETGEEQYITLSSPRVLGLAGILKLFRDTVPDRQWQLAEWGDPR